MRSRRKKRLGSDNRDNCGKVSLSTIARRPASRTRVLSNESHCKWARRRAINTVSQGDAGRWKMSVFTITLSQAQVELARRQATLCAINGKSNMRGAVARTEALTEDQIVGQLGQIALHLWHVGHVMDYVKGRHVQNNYPSSGDGGEDVIGAQLDVKTSLMRRSANPLEYNLLVRPRERHDGWVYVLALVVPTWETECQVHLVGWATDHQLPPAETDGPFAGAHRIHASSLHPLPPIKYRWKGASA